MSNPDRKRIVVWFNEDYSRAVGFNVPAGWDNEQVTAFVEEKYPNRWRSYDVWNDQLEPEETCYIEHDVKW